MCIFRTDPAFLQGLREHIFRIILSALRKIQAADEAFRCDAFHPFSAGCRADPEGPVSVGFQLIHADPGIVR